MKALIMANRLKYEPKILKENPQFILRKDENNPRIWYIIFDGAEKTLYEKEKFKLKFEFSDEYVIINLYIKKFIIAN